MMITDGWSLENRSATCLFPLTEPTEISESYNISYIFPFFLSLYMVSVNNNLQWEQVTSQLVRDSHVPRDDIKTKVGAGFIPANNSIATAIWRG